MKFKIIYINLYEGCKEKNKFLKVINFIKKERPDILGLSELNQWDKNNFSKLNKFKKQIDLNHSIFCKASSGYNLGLFSKYKLTDRVIISKNFKTGMIKASISIKNKKLSIILTHLHSMGEDLRLKEIDIIKNYVNKKEKVIFMGDLNSLSSKDNYNEPRLLKAMKKIKSNKFGERILRKEAIDKITKLGFIDSVRKFSKSFEYSVPTKYNKDQNHFGRLRLDYIFITKNLFKKLSKAKIIRTKETNQLSDHFPVVAEINL